MKICHQWRMFTCRDLNPKRMYIRPKQSSSGMYKCCRGNENTCRNTWLLHQAFCRAHQIPLLEISLSDTITRELVFQMNLLLLQRASQDSSSPRVSPSLFRRRLIITAGLPSAEGLPLQLSLICLTSSEMWFTCLSPKVVFSKNHSKMIICKLSSW